MTDIFKGKENRKFERANASFMMNYSLYGPSGIFLLEKESGIVRNISEGGLAFTTERKLDPATDLLINFTLIGRDDLGKSRTTPVTIRGEVVHNRQDDRGDYTIGVKITGINSGQKDAIASYVKNKTENLTV